MSTATDRPATQPLDDGALPPRRIHVPSWPRLLEHVAGLLLATASAFVTVWMGAHLLVINPLTWLRADALVPCALIFAGANLFRRVLRDIAELARQYRSARRGESPK